MCKVTNSSRNVTPFGGLFFIFDALSKLGVSGLISEHLGGRAPQCLYSYSDIVLSFFANSLTGGERYADLEHLKGALKEQSYLKLPSPDTLEYASRELKSATVFTKAMNNKGLYITHETNRIDSMNRLLVGLALKTGHLQPRGAACTLDFDNTISENEKQDSKYTYKKMTGYHPGIATINKVAVHLENRNGNTPASYGQPELLGRCLTNLLSAGIGIGRFRADSASYNAAVIDLAESFLIQFFIRAKSSGSLNAACAEGKDWKHGVVGGNKVEATSIHYKPTGSKSAYRVVAVRSRKPSCQLDLFTGDLYEYRCIITNDYLTPDFEVVEFYNQRGASENVNKSLLEDFNMSRLPHPDMDTNTVSMYFSCIANTLFEWVKSVLAKGKAAGVEQGIRTKALLNRYIAVAAEYIEKGAQKIMTMFTKKQYHILRI
jgi:Transposase DDE domain group 1